MERYDYLESVKEDVREWINEHAINITPENREDWESELNERLFCEDSVTGNASGSYTCNAWQAEENLCHNIDRPIKRSAGRVLLRAGVHNGKRRGSVRRVNTLLPAPAGNF